MKNVPHQWVNANKEIQIMNTYEQKNQMEILELKSTKMQMENSLVCSPTGTE